MTNPSIDWNKGFPATDGPGASGFFEPGWSGELMVQMTIIVPDDGQDYWFMWWQEYGGSEYQKLLSPGQNDLSFTLDNTSSDYGLVRALVFRDGGTSGVNVTIPEAPILSVPSGLVAEDDEATTSAGTPVTVDVLANDTYGDEPVSLSDLDGPPTIETQPQNGTVAVNADGTITYTPNPGFTGTDTFEYRITTPEPEPSCPEIWSSNGGFEMAELWSQIPAFGEFGGNGFYLINGSVGIAFWSSDGEYAYPDVGEEYPDCGHLGEWIMSWGDSTGEQCVIWENVCS